MKAKTIFLFLTIFVVSLANGQTLQQKRGVAQINQELEQLIELKILFQDIEDLNKRLKPVAGQYGPEGLEAKALNSRLDVLNKRLSAKQMAATTSYSNGEDLQKDLELLLAQKGAIEHTSFKQVVEQTTPKELRRLEKNRRKNSLEIRSGEVQLNKEQLSLEKLKNTSVYTNGAMGYRVVIWNQDRRKAGNFKLKDMSGKDIDGGSFYLAPGEKIETYLLPGKYMATVEMTGRLIASTTVEVGVNHKFVNGVAYHGYLIQPPR